MLQYILECIAFQLVFLIIYDLFLKRETFFQWNRAYLIGTYVISMIIPWVKIEAMKTTVPEAFQAYPEFLWNMNNAIVVTTTAEKTFNISWEYALLFGGMFLATLFFGYKLFQIYALKRKGEVHYFKDFTRIVVANSSLAFSFFKSIFLGDKVIEKEHQNILQHELVHIRQRHSYDLIFFELMRIVGWFNPLVYVYQSRVSELHEFIADAQVAKTHKKEQYQLLLSEVFQTQHISFINQFFKTSLIKKRIVMLQKTNSKKIWKLKYLLLVPLVFGMLAYTSAETLNDNIHRLEQNDADEKLIADTKKEIENEVAELGTLGNVFGAFTTSIYLLGETHIFTKNEYFKEQILYKMFFEEMKLFEFGDDVQPKKPLPEMTLPSTSRFESYVRRKEAFLILDENLQYSIKAYDQYVGLIDKKEIYPSTSYLFEVVDVKDLSGKELRSFNTKLAEIFEYGETVYSDIILTDGSYAFNVYTGVPKKDLSFYENNKAEGSEDKLPSGKGMTKISSIIHVENIEQLTTEEENRIFGLLTKLSEGKSNWELEVKDMNTSMKFIRANNGSYLSGPNGEKIAATLVYDSTLSEKSKLSITEFLKKNGTKNLEAQRAIRTNNQVVTKRNKLLKAEAIPFAKVDEVPVFPGCENDDDKRGCFYENMREHIRKNFSYPQEAQKKEIQGRVAIMFTMNIKGEIANVKVRGPHKLLEDEAVRIISKLPKLQPGKHEGKDVNVIFSIPITFKLNSDNPNYQIIPENSTSDESLVNSIRQYNQLVTERKRLLESADEKNSIIVNLDEQLEGLKKSLQNQLPSETKQTDYDNNVDVPFAVVEEIPIFPGCEDDANKRDCFNTMMQKHISKNFNYPKEAQEKGIQGRVSIMFTIDEEGRITNIRKRGPNTILENEADRIIKLLPGMTPGMQKGKAVRVPYSIPITFKLQGKGWESDLMKLADMTENIPIFFVDEVASSKTEVMEMNQKEIESIFALKGEAAIKKYGQKGKHGVLEITTKKKD